MSDGFDYPELAARLERGTFAGLDRDDKLRILAFLSVQVLACQQIDEMLSAADEEARKKASDFFQNVKRHYVSLRRDLKDAYTEQRKQLLDKYAAEAAKLAEAGESKASSPGKGTPKGTPKGSKKKKQQAAAAVADEATNGTASPGPGKGGAKNPVSKERDEIKARKVEALKAALQGYQAEDDKLQKEADQKERQHLVTIEHDLLPMRVSPLGKDRYHRRYWLFPTTKGVLIEPPVSKDFVTLSVSDANKPVAADDTNMEVTEEFLRSFENEPWRRVANAGELEQLLEALSPRGLREKELKAAIELRKDVITKSINAARAKRTQFWFNKKKAIDDTAEFLLGCARESVLNTEAQLWQNSMLEMPDRDAWRARATAATSVQELGALLINLLEQTPVRYLKKASDQEGTFFLGPPDEAAAPAADPAPAADAALAADTASATSGLPWFIYSC